MPATNPRGLGLASSVAGKTAQSTKLDTLSLHARALFATSTNLPGGMADARRRDTAQPQLLQDNGTGFITAAIKRGSQMRQTGKRERERERARVRVEQRTHGCV